MIQLRVLSDGTLPSGSTKPFLREAYPLFLRSASLARRGRVGRVRAGVFSVVVSRVVVVVVLMMLSRRAVPLKLDLREVGTVGAGVLLRELTVDKLGLAGVAGGGRGQEASSEATE